MRWGASPPPHLKASPVKGGLGLREHLSLGPVIFSALSRSTGRRMQLCQLVGRAAWRPQRPKGPPAVWTPGSSLCAEPLAAGDLCLSQNMSSEGTV